MRHTGFISRVRRVPASAIDADDAAKYIAQALDIFSALIGSVSGWVALQEQKNSTGT